MSLSKHKRSRKQEASGATAIGGRPVARSGAGWAVKNDVKNDRFSVEYKFTDKKSYSLKLDDLLQAERHALLDSGRSFAFVVELGGREWLILPFEDGQELLRGHSK